MDKSIFTEEELNTIKEIKKYFKNFGFKQIAAFSHKEKNIYRN